ncbi:hypothetical protein [Gracilibacillus halophilus]|uniref:hypothetical protein n=1 Tax=Gracilibacillus halophilus TaxID=470864 RepID=UPI00039DC565|nr:hypothetical protein [Gracilibacillus halophilus]
MASFDFVRYYCFHKYKRKKYNEENYIIFNFFYGVFAFSNRVDTFSGYIYAIIGIELTDARVQPGNSLSRLNRICKGKNDTFVLDFANEAEDMQKAFEPYYEVTQLEEATDPNVLYDIQTELDAFQVYSDSEIEEVVEIEYSGKQKNAKVQEKLNSYLDKAVNRFKDD